MTIEKAYWGILIAAAAALCPLAGLAASETYEIEIHPRGHVRENAPATVDLPARNSELISGEGFLVCHILDMHGRKTGFPAQVERVEKDGETYARIYWVHPKLGHDGARHYRVRLEDRGYPEGGKTGAFRFESGEGFRDLYHGGRRLLRHVTAFDPENFEETFKPYYHLYGFREGKRLTKGPGGLYSHQRGLFLGWNETRFDGRTLDFWHGRDGVSQRHATYLPEREVLGPVVARFASHTDWLDGNEETVLSDIREVTVWRISDKSMFLDVTIELQAAAGDVVLGGTPHSSGFHFRAAQEVADNQENTLFLRPDGASDQGNDIWADAGWAVALFGIQGSRYAVMHMDHPSNPRPSLYSARDYGRFGSFFTAGISEGETLALRYGILVGNPENRNEVSAAHFERAYMNFYEPVEVLIKEPNR